MASSSLLLSPSSPLFSLPKPTQNPTKSNPFSTKSLLENEPKPFIDYTKICSKVASGALLGAGFALIVDPAYASDSLLQLSEPSNALSLPTWAIHVSSVAEWVTAMVLVWQYGERSGYESWKGLSWGMVPLLGGALCACTWHFFYNSEDLAVLVALQAALTVIGNATMCLAALRIYKASEESAKNS